MTKFGVMAGTDIANILMKIYRACGVDFYTDNFLSGNHAERFFISEERGICFILKHINKSDTEFGKDDIILLNSDDKNNLKLPRGSRARVITYGLNNKACVTASSILDEELLSVQFCIQRSLPTLSGKVIEEQEFPLKLFEKSDVGSVLAATTLLLMNDFGIENLKSCIL